MSDTLVNPDFREVLVREIEGAARAITLCVCMQNPSTAEADPDGKNDPTIHRLVGFARRLGYGRLVVVNTYLKRTSDPKELYRWLFEMPFWERNKHRDLAYLVALREAFKADTFVAAWGNGRGDDKWPEIMARRLRADGVKIHVFGLNSNGTPKHPLARGRERIPDDAVPVLWEAA